MAVIKLQVKLSVQLKIVVKRMLGRVRILHNVLNLDSDHALTIHRQITL